MSTNHSQRNRKPVSRREAMQRGLGCAAGVVASGGLGTRAFAAADNKKSNTDQAAAKKAARDKAAKAKAGQGQTKSIIQIFLWGGMSHNDTWDPKPGTGRDYLGEFDEVIPTNVDGIRLGSLFPELAKQADKYALIRGMTHGIKSHETAAYVMQTGHKAGGRQAYPSIGANFTYLKKDEYEGIIPPYIVLTQASGRFSEEGFLGPAYKPFATGGNPNAKQFQVQGIVAGGISEQRQKARRALLGEINTMAEAMAASPKMQEIVKAKEKAYELILGEGKEVFDLSHEKKELRDRYGRHKFGQECLAARRMVEAGVPYVTINFPGGWDTHKGHFERMNRQCPQLDQGLATLLADLSDRGLLDSTLVWCTGEFGRRPKISWEPPWNGGRHHYGKVFTVLVAGGGFKGGRVVGSSDELGEEVAERPVYPADLLGSIYLLAGIDLNAKLPHPLGVDVHVLDVEKENMKSAGLLAEIM